MAGLGGGAGGVGAQGSGLSASVRLAQLRALLGQKTGAVGGPSAVGGDYASKR